MSTTGIDAAIRWWFSGGFTQACCPGLSGDLQLRKQWYADAARLTVESGLCHQDPMLKLAERLEQDCCDLVSADRPGLQRVYHLAMRLFCGREVVRNLKAREPVEHEIFHYYETPCVARAVTRYVTGAFSLARRWLQRKAWGRQQGSGAAPAAVGPTSPPSESCGGDR